MIEINLLPEELRNRVVKPLKTEALKTGAKPGAQQLILLVPVIFIVLIIVHIVMVFSGIAKASQLNMLKAKWNKAAPERKILEDFKNEHTLNSGVTNEMQKLLNERITWADKLNRLSLALPPGVWFEAISVSGKVFLLEGKAASLNKDEISLLRNFIDGLKNKPDFTKNFSSLELSSIQKEAIAGQEVADFKIAGTLK